VPRITAIKPQQRNPKRVSVYIDGKFALGCSASVLAEMGISSGEQISDAQLSELRESAGSDDIRYRALRYLARRARSRQEMRKYLNGKGYRQEQIAEVIAWLQELNYLDDKEFADSWVGSRLRIAPRGRYRLLRELAEKGISKDQATAAVDAQLPDNAEPQVALELLRRSRGRWAGKERLEIKRKVYNFLRYRGFAGSTIVEATETFLEETCAGSDD
jgi:regulatory protein